MKSIAYVLGTFPVLSETFVGNEMRAMAARGHGIVPIVLRRPAGTHQTIDATLASRATYLDQIGRAAAPSVLASVPVRAARSSARGLEFVRRQQALPSRSLLWNAAKIAAVARRRGCTHLHAHFAEGAAAHALVAARLIGATVSFVGHGYDVYGSPSDLETKLMAADFAVAVCGDMAADMRRLAPCARIETVPCGIDPLRFKPATGDEPDNGRLLFVGRLVEQKGVDDLLTALALLPPDRRPGLDIVGTGPLHIRLEQRVRSLGF